MSFPRALPVLAFPTTTTGVPDPGRNPFGRYLQDPWGTLGHAARHLGQVAAATGHRLAVPVAAALLLAVAGRVVLGRWRAARLRRGARLVEILQPPEVDPQSAVAFWRNLRGLLHQRRLLQGRPHVALELRWTPAGLCIGVWVPGMVAPRLVERAVQAAWPGAHTRTHTPAPPALPQAPRGRNVRGGRLGLAAPECYPLRTAHDRDPLRALLGAAEELGAGEAGIVQVLVRRARGRRLAACRRAARALRRGQAPTRRGRLLDFLNPLASDRGSRRAYTEDPTRHADVAAITAKSAEPGFEVAIRYGVATCVDEGWRGRLRARGHALAAAFAVFADRNQLTRRRLWRPAVALEARRLGRGMLLCLGELAALAHLPWDRGVPGLERAGAKSVPPAPSVPRHGKVLGDADAGAARPVALAVADARQHAHVLGGTGTGKSTLLANLVLQDVAAGRGVVVVDPAKGDLVRELLERLPASAAGRLVLLDPDEQTAPPTLNMLEGADPDVATDHLLATFRRVFASAWGPRTDDILRSACLTLLAKGPATLVDVPRLLTKPGYRRHLTAGLGDELLAGFWGEYDRLTAGVQAQLVGPALSRLRAFLLRPFVREVVGSTTSSFDLATDVLDGGILLARLPKGVLGDDTARLLGSFVVAKVWQAASQRARAGEHARTDAALYVDEFHNVLHLPQTYEELLAEARGYRLALTLAHHNLAQLPRELREALSANARSKVYFACSPEDAHVLERHVAPELSAHDLSHLGAFQAATRLVTGGVEAPACTLTTRPLAPSVEGRAARLRAAARARYGRTAAQRRTELVRRQLHHDHGPGPTPPPGGHDAASAPPDPPRPVGPDGSRYESPYESGDGSPYGLGPVEGWEAGAAGQHSSPTRARGADSGTEPSPSPPRSPDGERGGR